MVANTPPATRSGTASRSPVVVRCFLASAVQAQSPHPRRPTSPNAPLRPRAGPKSEPADRQGRKSPREPADRTSGTCSPTGKTLELPRPHRPSDAATLASVRLRRGSPASRCVVRRFMPRQAPWAKGIRESNCLYWRPDNISDGACVARPHAANRGRPHQGPRPTCIAHRSAGGEWEHRRGREQSRRAVARRERIEIAEQQRSASCTTIVPAQPKPGDAH